MTLEFTLLYKNLSVDNECKCQILSLIYVRVSSTSTSTINHKILIKKKLECYGIRRISHKWFENYLENGKQIVKYKRCSSIQGSIFYIRTTSACFFGTESRGLIIIHPNLNYKEALKKAELKFLYDRRENLSTKLFNSIENDNNHKLHKLLPEDYTSTYNLRKTRNYKLPIIRTDRFKKSFLINQAINCNL